MRKRLESEGHAADDADAPDLTLREASDRLADDFEADIADCDAVEAEIPEMSHMLARGIVLQFPQKFS